MRIFKRILSQLHRYVFWAIISTIFWAWIFWAFVTDTLPRNKVELYAHAEIPSERDMTVALEAEPLPEGIRLIKVPSYSYVMFDSETPTHADLYIVSESDVAEGVDGFGVMPARNEGDLVRDGKVYGWRVYDAKTGEGCASSYLTFDPNENYYLCVNVNSKHAAAWNGSGDDAAIEIAGRILELP